MKKIVLAGGSGHLGTLLKHAYVKAGWEVVILSRQREKKEVQVSYVVWDGEHLGTWVHALEDADAVINLSGKSVQCRFTSKNRALLEDSRILPTRALANAISACNKPPRLWINFSGISIFSGLDGCQDEASTTVGTGYLAQLTQRWESAFTAVDLPDTQQVVLRVSPVLSPQWGMLSELLPLTKRGLGGQVADGGQYVSWIHQEDFVRMVQWIVERAHPSQIYHACSPYPVTNAAFMKALRKTVGVSFGLPLPRLLAHVGAFVKGVDPGMLLDSVPATTTFTRNERFNFGFSHIEEALADLLKKR